MAGIEKRCEYSGEYCGWDMYGWKHNNIQIMPKYRKLFRGAKATLIIRPNRYGDDYTYKYEFTLIVTDENLLGKVNGKYFNFTGNTSAVIRKMKRLVGNRNLKIKKSNAPLENPFKLN